MADIFGFLLFGFPITNKFLFFYVFVKAMLKNVKNESKAAHFSVYMQTC